MPLFRNFWRAVVALAAGAAALAGGDPVGDQSSDAVALVRGNNQFALESYQQLSTRGGNLAFSPFSISAALAMTHAGARGETAQEMAAALHFPFTGPRLDPTFRELFAGAEGGESRGYELTVANGLWGERRFRFRPEFLERVKAHYGAELAEMDFAAQAEASRHAINAWVEKQTRGKIQNLISPGAITELTKLVLANAIYFHGQWADPFQKRATRDAPFKVTPQQEVSAPLMVQQDEFDLLETRSFQALRMAYQGGDLAMVVFLPRRADGLEEFEKTLTVENLDSWLGRLKRREVQVYLPKFRVESAFKLNEPLAARGMRRAFSDDADFSGMTGGKDLMISIVVHKAFVEVDEKGTEAAAATAVIMAPTAAPPGKREPPAVFRADHPFVFLVRDQRSGSILFLGRVANPKG
jgi:serpin B